MNRTNRLPLLSLCLCFLWRESFVKCHWPSGMMPPHWTWIQLRRAFPSFSSLFFLLCNRLYCYALIKKSRRFYRACAAGRPDGLKLVPQLGPLLAPNLLFFYACLATSLFTCLSYPRISSFFRTENTDSVSIQKFIFGSSALARRIHPEPLSRRPLKKSHILKAYVFAGNVLSLVPALPISFILRWYSSDIFQHSTWIFSDGP